MDATPPAGFTLRQLARFVAVAETGTISGAAERLFMAQSSVAASVGELERAIGEDLMIRRRAEGVSLTPMGRIVLERAKMLLSDAAELGYLARSRGTSLVGPLAIGCFVTLAPVLVPRLLEEFASQHPLVTLNFIEGDVNRLEQALQDGEVDVAVMYQLDVTGPFTMMLLSEPRGYVLFHPKNPLATKPEITLADLAPEPLALFDRAPSVHYAMSLFEGEGLTPNIRHRTQTYELTRSLVARNLAYAILVQRPITRLSYEGLPIVERELTPLARPAPVVLAWVRDRRLSPRAKALADLAQRLFTEPATTRPSSLES